MGIKILNGKVTQIWSQDVCNLVQTKMVNRWGLGDLLRGTENIHAACCDLGLDFELDYNQHPISKIFSKNIGKINKKETQFKNFNSKNDLNEYILKESKLGLNIEMMSNGYGLWNGKHANDFRNFIKPRLILNEKYTSKAKNFLPIPNSYNVLHIRLGDSHLIDGGSDVEGKIIKLFERNADENTYLCTDSIALKNFAIKEYGLNTLPVNPVHFGLDASVDNLFNSHLEFMLMGGARVIKSYSCYSWISGFAKSASFIYEVPLINLGKKTLLGKFANKILFYLNKNN